MRTRRVPFTLPTALALIAVAAGAGFAWFKFSPRRTPAGQPSLSRLDAATLPALKDAFNAATGETRVLLFFSPT